ncbi:hypothetical protein L1987_09370 [Smallanthus sonchifolius]|uniref:Uncharacterized protein n=1 Tax=Smallanthus sonchifolius TaxID=185202 RepID=A0ACB9JN77_9ASTR|nr:hypothetical protein L1987_09370 [Smallanthus sonchifolius]
MERGGRVSRDGGGLGPKNRQRSSKHRRSRPMHVDSDGRLQKCVEKEKEKGKLLEANEQLDIFDEVLEYRALNKEELQRRMECRKIKTMKN